MTFVRKLLTVAALASAGSAFAADTTGGYLLIGGGTSKYDDSCAGTTSCDTTGKAAKIVGGYRLGNGFAIEAVGLDFGKATATSQGVGVEFKGTAYGAGVAVHSDFAQQWLFSARLGIASVKVKGTGRLGNVVVSDSENTTSAYVGLGVAYRFTDMVSVELGYDSTRGKFGGESENISAVTVGLGIKF